MGMVLTFSTITWTESQEDHVSVKLSSGHGLAVAQGDQTSYGSGMCDDKGSLFGWEPLLHSAVACMGFCVWCKMISLTTTLISQGSSAPSN